METHNGWINDNAKLAWLKILIQSEDNDVGQYPILLLADGHFTNHNTDFHELCWDNNLFPYTWPGHLTQLLQLMDARQGVITNFRKKIHLEVARKTAEYMHNEINLKTLQNKIAETATIAITNYNNDPEMEKGALSALRCCGSFEQAFDKAHLECQNDVTMTTPCRLKYLPSQVKAIQDAMDLDPNEKMRLKTKRREWKT